MFLTFSRRYPPLEYPKYPDISKGWYAQACSGETQQNQLSFSFLKAVREKRWIAVNYYLKYRLDLDLFGDDDKTAIHLAIELRHEELVRFLLQQGVDLDVSDENGHTPLHLACFCNDLRLVRCLLFCGANAHRLTADGANVLHFCAVNGNIRMAKKFIKLGVDLTCKIKNSDVMPLNVAQKFNQFEMAVFLQVEMDKQTQTLKDYMAKLQAEEDAKAQSWVRRKSDWAGQAVTPSKWRGDDTFGRLTYTRKEERKFWDSYGDPNNGDPNNIEKRVRFVEPDGDDDYADDGEWNSHEGHEGEEVILTECVHCGSLEESEQDHCVKCGYILHEVCPECYAIIDSPSVEDNCPKCFTSLWARKLTKSGLTLTCSICNSDESVCDKYCGSCGYVLLDMCPHCSSICVKGKMGALNNNCPLCDGDLWDGASVITKEEEVRTKEVRIFLTTQCAICKHEQSVQNDYCEECNYALSDICPNCLHMPTSMAPKCPKCHECLWRDT